MIVFSMSVNAQDESWTLQTTVENVNFYYQIVDCDDNSVILLKFDNKNDFDVKVYWKQIIGTEQVPNTTQESVQQFEVVLNSGVTAPEGCTDQTLENLVIMPFEVDPTYLAEITNFSFSSISIEKTNQP